MNEQSPPGQAAHGPCRYEIRIKGHLADRWSDSLAGLALTRDVAGTTLLAGVLSDQAALHGVLARLRDLALPIISVGCVGPEAPGSDSSPPQTG